MNIRFNYGYYWAKIGNNSKDIIQIIGHHSNNIRKNNNLEPLFTILRFNNENLQGTEKELTEDGFVKLISKINTYN